MWDLTDDPWLCACLHVRRATRVVTRYFDDSLAATGIPVTQFHLLAAIHGKREMTVRELADLFDTESSTMARNVRLLIKGKLLASSVGRDRRERFLKLTAKGTRLYEHCLEIWKKAQCQLVEHFGEKRYRQLLWDLATITPSATTPL